MIVVAGIGCQRNCGAEPIVGLVRNAAQRMGRPVARLSAPEFKSNEQSLWEASQILGLPLVLVARDALQVAQARCQTLSAMAESATGFASVAEGSALAAVGPAGRLILPRIAMGGATCALAEGPAP